MQQVCACQYNFCYCSSPWVSGSRSSIDVVLLKTQVLVCVWTACTATADTAKLMHGKTFIRENRCKPLLALGNHSSAAVWEKHPTALHKNTHAHTHKTSLSSLFTANDWLVQVFCALGDQPQWEHHPLKRKTKGRPSNSPQMPASLPTSRRRT